MRDNPLYFCNYQLSKQYVAAIHYARLRFQSSYSSTSFPLIIMHFLPGSLTTKVT